MDLFNKKKLSEKEAEIGALQENSQRLEKEICELEAQIKELKEVKQREIKLHQDVVDTMLREIQALIVDNSHKELSLRTTDTLLPLIKDMINKKNFTIDLGIDLPSIIRRSGAGEKELQEALLISCKHIIKVWEEGGLVDKGIIDNMYLRDKSPHFIDLCHVKVFSTFELDDFFYKLKEIPKARYNYKPAKIEWMTKDIKIKNTQRGTFVEVNFETIL